MWTRVRCDFDFYGRMRIIVLDVTIPDLGLHIPTLTPHLHVSIPFHSHLGVFPTTLYRYQKADLDVVLFTNLPPSRQSYSPTRIRRSATAVYLPNTLTDWTVHTSCLSSGSSSPRAFTTRCRTTLPYTNHCHDVSWSTPSRTTTSTVSTSSWTTSDSCVDRHLAWLCSTRTTASSPTTLCSSIGAYGPNLPSPSSTSPSRRDTYHHIHIYTYPRCTPLHAIPR